jgi:hypothetical protein
MLCPVPGCNERLALQGLIWIVNSEPVSAGACQKHGVIIFRIGEKMNREEARRYYHQTAAMLEGSAPDAYMAYPEGHPERIKYETKMAKIAKEFPGIEKEG